MTQIVVPPVSERKSPLSRQANLQESAPVRESLRVVQVANAICVMLTLGVPVSANHNLLKELLSSGDPEFSNVLFEETVAARDFATVLKLCTLRKHGLAKGLIEQPEKVHRIAMVGGASLHPLIDLIDHFVTVLGGVRCEIWTGDFDNYHAEVLDDESELYTFMPDVVLVLPSERRCVYNGPLASPRADQEKAAREVSQELLNLCSRINERSGAEVILGNFRLPPYYDPGQIRSTSLASTYAFRKLVNSEISASLQSFLYLCDIEFISNRFGNLSGTDDRTWYESKQPFAAGLMVEIAREYAHILCSLRTAAKKVVVLDLDNTLWGGVIGDDGLEGIELGTTSSRGEAFRAFQSHLLELSKRGILLAVCSKNDYDRAIEPFEHHPEMVLGLKDISSFKANWEPKSENIRQIAQELNLGLDSMVFVDDNRAEIDIVNQFTPEVATIWVGDDPSAFVAKLKDSRYFEVRSITEEDVERVKQYEQESKRKQLLGASTNMTAYLESLEMVATLKPFNALDAPRIAQLTSKSNQFNLTTQRRTEAEIHGLIDSSRFPAFTVRLSDRFGEHGLISVVIGEIRGHVFFIDTWLMSCRVLKRQVENEVLNHIVQLAKAYDCTHVFGHYIPSAKNGMVRDLYPSLGFHSESEEADSSQVYSLAISSYQPVITQICTPEEFYAKAASH